MKRICHWNNTEILSKKRLSSAAVLALLISLSGRNLILAQHQEHAQQVPLLIDGSKAPELIPDNLAYRHFLISVAVPLQATPAQVSGRLTRLKRAGLRSDDIASFISALDLVSEQLTYFAEEERRVYADSASTSERGSRITEEHRKRDAFIDAVAGKALLTLSREGRVSLEAYVKNQVKSHIKVFGVN